MFGVVLIAIGEFIGLVVIGDRFGFPIAAAVTVVHMVGCGLTLGLIFRFDGEDETFTGSEGLAFSVMLIWPLFLPAWGAYRLALYGFGGAR